MKKKVTNVVMNGKTGSMNEELSIYPSEFVLENRQVQRVCSHPQEPEWVTNIKKGVISSFQSTILPEGSSLGFNVTEVCTRFRYNQTNIFTVVLRNSVCIAISY